MKTNPAIDPKNLIEDSFKIEGISRAECRSIFVDWALSLQADDPSEALTILLERHRDEPEDHPMKVLLREGLTRQSRTGRRGGRSARIKHSSD